MSKITKTAMSLLLSTIILSGCLGGFSPNANFYTLSSDDRVEMEPMSLRKMTIQIQNVEIPDYLAQPQIVTRDTNQVEIRKNEFNRWGAPLGEIIQHTIASDISAFLPQAQVRISDSVYVPEAYNVAVEITRLDGTWEHKAVIEGWWQISDKNGKVLASSRTLLKTPLGKEDYVALVEAESILVAGLSQEITQALLSLK